MTLKDIQSAIADLPREEFDRLFRWMKEEFWEAWDREIEADDCAGKLDFLREEADAEKANGTLGGL